MIFRRRERPPLLARLRESLMPRKGMWRGMGYIGKRMRRLPDSPHRIALGFACGAFISFTPFFGFHFLLAALLAWILRGNVLAGIFGTVVGNPLTFPLISVSSLWLGRWMLGRTHGGSEFEKVSHAFAEGFNAIWGTVKSWFGHGPSMLDGLLMFLDDILLPYLIGGIIPGLVTAALCYWLIGPIVAAYQERRRRRLELRAGERRRAAEAEQALYARSDGMEGDNV
jgi:hypothetical protein